MDTRGSVIIVFSKIKLILQHDHTVTALLHTLGAKQAVMGVDIAQYAATVICELWLKDGEYFVRVSTHLVMIPIDR